MNRRKFIAATAAGFGTIATTSALMASPKDQLMSGEALFDYALSADTFWLERPFIDRLAMIAESGFTYFDFWRFQDKDIDLIARMCRQHRLTPVQFVAGWSMNNAERREKFLQDLKEAVVVADALGIGKVTVIAGFEIEGMSREQQIQEVIKSLQQAEPIARKANLTLMIEPVNVLVDHPGQLVVTSAQAADIVQAIDSPHVRMLFDVYHQQISEGNLSGNIEKFKHLIAYYQIADHPGRHEPGTGEINFVGVLQAIHATGYAGPIGLEFHPKENINDALQSVLEIDRAAAAG